MIAVFVAIFFGLIMGTAPVAKAETSEGGAKITSTGDIQVVDSGTTPTGGWVEFTGIGEVTIEDASPENSGGISTYGLTTSKVGGGTWTYGSSIRVTGQKVCFSQYYNGSRRHSATVSMGGKSDSEARPAGETAEGRLAQYTTSTCRAWWSNL